ncbi:hypothetical protein PGT21_026553 [Puccinia graminis f. sp. tritici]|uniref:Uncharacterized protein n=1 Tax=Puccinia graminis f. sp. tritici TaxID=56615 RepID=A0A5B0QK97_PUCGR|nr:hypothetical protein PGT21_026553 [Puccinia graminis f. sp. tritici]KAA1113608.1 hypothetical protein PGTUg99_005666 [Puccinia graminis f. sp. tritici]
MRSSASDAQPSGLCPLGMMTIERETLLPFLAQLNLLARCHWNDHLKESRRRMLSNPTQQQQPTINPFLRNNNNNRTPTHERVTKTSRITEMNSVPNQHQQQQDETNNINNPYNETPSTEPFNIDPDLVRVLAKNQAIIARSPPRFILFPSSSDHSTKQQQEEEEERSLIHIISRTQLDRLGRLADSEQLYFNEFSRIIKLKYDSSCLYLQQRLNFPLHLENKLNKDGGRGQPAFFCADGRLQDRRDYRVIRNEWPYAIPRDYQHIVVWSRLPLLDPSQARTSAELKQAHHQGLSGFENLSPELVDRLTQAGLNPDLKLTPFPAHHPGVRGERAGLDAQIRAFIRTRWPHSRGFIDLLWFLNPVHLQSCPQLPHFHVFVKKTT